MSRIHAADSKEATVVFVMEGRVIVGIGDKEICTVYSGEMFFLSVKQNFFVEIKDEDSYALSTVLDLKDCLNGYCSIEELIPYYKPEPNLAILKVKPRLRQYLLLLDGYLSDGYLSKELMEVKKQEFIHHLFVYYSLEEIASFLNPFLDKDLNFKEFVLVNYQKANSVTELAKMANYSTSGFIKKFKRTFGCPPLNWIIAQRVSIVSKELSTGKAIKEVAMDNGFSSYEHFCRFCKLYIGSTPAEIRTGKKGKRTESWSYRRNR